ncbi:MAG: PEP/pyruvate-binding domain-containing protein [Thermodesulfobacteriota bacterium]
MKRLIHFFKSRLTGTSSADTVDVEGLRIAFKERYHHFKLLLNANNSALEIMTAMEQALAGRQPFGMSFVRSNCIAITVNLLRLLKHLEQLSGGKYNPLYGRFDEIMKNVSALIEQKKEPADQRAVIPLADVDRTMADLVGGKMANLGEIRNKVGLKVPAGFVISARAYQHFIAHNDLQADIDKRFIAIDITDMEALYAASEEIRKMIISAPLPEDLEQEMTGAAGALEQESGGPVPMALRSSAMGEDSAANSFAGQYHSELNVSLASLVQTYKEVVASKYSLTAITYRLNKGIRDEDIAMSVGCLAMVDARCGGVMYTRNPLDAGDDSIFINSAWGLPKAVVDGSVDCDLFVVARTEPLEISRRDIRDKKSRFVCRTEGGTCRMETVDETVSQPSIRDDEATALAELAVRMELYYGSPQDVEWAIDRDGTVYILQCRPLRQMESGTAEVSDALMQKARENVLASGGTVICPGIAAGEVFIVTGPDDMVRFPEGGVLVASQALPLWASLLNRTAAVLTEHGTFAGHLANVAREFQVPAIFGLKDLTRTLKNGDRVTVDAGSACVYAGIVDLPQRPADSDRSRIEGSPVYNTLLEVSRYIIPLNLLDPYSPDFKPENCQTFHDITRFAHEKSVQEMFNFGRDHDFSERSSKQLFYKVPMQWWILNLDDGVREDARGKHIRLEEITSVPMLALWEGMIAVPWDGPPPIDNKGLASVMFRSTANRDLETSVKSAYTERNYFMISKNYCSFTSRLGYHFSTVESLVSERTAENYISFRFKGGAADSQRRIRRIRFIADILTDHGFRVETNRDNLVARVEGFEIAFMLERLKILGYLVLHTRQLDMIMSNEAAIAYYREKINADIRKSVLAGQAGSG